jgi:hypothetical protein
MKTKRKYLKNYIHPKLTHLCTSTIYGESGEVLDNKEPLFSWSPCDCCGSDLGGDRFECDPVIDTKESITGGGSERYLSEDYMFCQMWRKMGGQIYLCPWMKTQHIGTYAFSGNMPAVAQYTGKL